MTSQISILQGCNGQLVWIEKMILVNGLHDVVWRAEMLLQLNKLSKNDGVHGMLERIDIRLLISCFINLSLHAQRY